MGMINKTASVYGAPNLNALPRHADNVARMNVSRSEAAAVLGSASGGDKAKAAQKNGAKGGRPVGS